MQVEPIASPGSVPAAALHGIPAHQAPAAVAIITPYYNTGAVFAETTASVFAQTLQQWQWVIVNDGSDDPQALAALTSLRDCGDPRIQIIDQSNRGLPAARNAGVAASSAPLLFFLDSDDLLEPTALEKLAWLMHSDPRPALATAWRVNFGAKNELEARGFAARDHFLWENTATALVMLRRSIFDIVGGYDETRRSGLEDYELYLRLAAAGYWGRDLPEFLLRVRFKLPADYGGYAWPSRDDPQRLEAFLREMRRHYPQLYRAGVPPLPPRDERPFAPLPTDLPFANLLQPLGRRRLLMLVPNLNCGGVSNAALAMLDQLANRGDRLTVCATDFGPHPLYDEFARYADVFVLDRFLERADRPRFLRYLVESRGVDAILLNDSIFGYRLLPYLRAYCPQVALLDYSHMPEPIYANGGAPGFSAEYAGLLDTQLVSSEFLRDWMVARGADPERIQVVYIGADTERWRPDAQLRAATRVALGIAADEPLILFAGRMVPQKQPLLLARILSQLSARNLRFSCVAAGAGPELPRLRAALRRNRIEQRVQLPGQVDAEQMRALMAAADVLLLPSAYEGLALVLYEALASGVVPVAAASGGQAELVTPDCGVLVAAGDRAEDQYVAALDWLLRAPRQRQAMALAGRKRAQVLFSISSLGEGLDQAIARASRLAQTQPRPPVDATAARVAASAAVELQRHYERNRRFGPALRAWQLWHGHGSKIVGVLGTLRNQAVLKSYPLRRTLRPYWHRLRNKGRRRPLERRKV